MLPRYGITRAAVAILNLNMGKRECFSWRWDNVDLHFVFRHRGWLWCKPLARCRGSQSDNSGAVHTKKWHGVSESHQGMSQFARGSRGYQAAEFRSGSGYGTGECSSCSFLCLRALQQHARCACGFSPGHQVRMLLRSTEIWLWLRHLWTAGTKEEDLLVKPQDRNLPLDLTSCSFVFTWATSLTLRRSTASLAGVVDASSPVGKTPKQSAHCSVLWFAIKWKWDQDLFSSVARNKTFFFFQEYQPRQTPRVEGTAPLQMQDRLLLDREKQRWSEMDKKGLLLAENITLFYHANLQFHQDRWT